MKFARFYEIPVTRPITTRSSRRCSAINPNDISHEDCMQTIERMGKHVIPEFK